jgi:cbb3-type cytochrome oxidase subunit 3
MSLSEIMSSAGLSIYAEIGLVIFLAVFVGVAIYTFWTKREVDFEDTKRIPLEDEVVTPREGEPVNGGNGA